MFGGSRRRQPPTAPLTSATANPNATTAAASAFMSAANQNSNKALSSAAAAAALRARPHTPTNVADVQTKRTLRRSASASSSGSAPAGARGVNGHRPLERRSSTASMTERTFRSPSPHRSSTPVPREQKPPVPQIPDSHRHSTRSPRGTGVGMQNFRTASQKMKTEPPSWHVQPTGDTSNVRTSDTLALIRSSPPRPPNITTSQPTRSDSRSSVNFSYPTAFRPQSPPASPTSSSISRTKSSTRPSTATSNPNGGSPSNSHAQSSRQLVYDPNSRRMVPRSYVEESVEHQTKMEERSLKKRRDGAPRREGSQLAKGTVLRTKETTRDEDRNQHKLSRPEQPVTEVLPAAGKTPMENEPATKAIVGAEPPEPNTSTDSPGSRVSVFLDPPPSASKTPKEHGSPSRSGRDIATLVQDEPTTKNEKLNTAGPSQPPQTVLDALDAVPTRQALFGGSHLPEPSCRQDRHEAAHYSRPSTFEKPGQPEINAKQGAIVAENKPVTVLASESDGPRRSSSNSPARQARFAPGPTERLAIRHVPLPRSASPIKSAMKHIGPVPRETSPSDNISDPSGSGAVSPDQKEDPNLPRKKSVRVSFDDHSTVIVGDSPPATEAGSPAAQSPQSVKRHWFSHIGRNKKKETALDEDEIMKPRPALPSFGSIRDKKTREPEERPLVRPLESAYSPAIPSSPELRPQSSSTLNDSETTEEPSLGQSEDHTIGTLLAQDQTSRNAANISRFREPLPPVVTSIEGYGYGSDSAQSSDYEDDPGGTAEVDHATMNSSVADTELIQPHPSDSSQDTLTAADAPRNKQEETRQTAGMQHEGIPLISVIQPSPMASEHSPRANGSPVTQYFDVPGGFPDSTSDFRHSDRLKTAINHTIRNDLPPDNPVVEPAATNVESGHSGIHPHNTPDTTTRVTDPDTANGEESDESIYSDAYEDIPDSGYDGFMSLDAVVESPTDKETRDVSPETAESLLSPVITSEPKHDPATAGASAGQGQVSPPRDANDWEQAKAFWRSLTAEKRRQLELEAAEEAGAEGDREEVSQPVHRASSKKKSLGTAQSSIQMPPPSDNIVQLESRPRMSLRDKPPTQSSSTQSPIGMRKTLRSNGGAQNGTKIHGRQAAGTKRPASTPSVPSQIQAMKSRPYSSTLPESSVRITAQTKPTLQRQESDASDSSFKRSRRPTSGTSAFRKTMRRTPLAQPHHESTGGSGRFSLRSLSPVGSTIRHESNANPAASSPSGMRRTLRSNSESSHEGKRSSIHFPLFARPTKSSPKTSKWTSRFDDSSDDGETFAGFRSRINDSSGEDESHPALSRNTKSPGKIAIQNSATAPGLSRPAPVPELEEDSPELPDSDDDHTLSPLPQPQRRITNSHYGGRLETGKSSSGAIGTSTLGRSRSGRGEFKPPLTSPVPPEQDSHGSFLSILRRNKRASQTGKIQRSGLLDSAARRDTKLERDPGQLKGLRSEQPPSPKLQKKTSISRSESGGLPKLASVVGSLPGQSTTTGAMTRPTLDNRRSVSLGHSPNPESLEFENASIDSSGLPKKKKFRALRRMFRLDE